MRLLVSLRSREELPAPRTCGSRSTRPSQDQAIRGKAMRFAVREGLLRAMLRDSGLGVPVGRRLPTGGCPIQRLGQGARRHAGRQLGGRHFGIRHGRLVQAPGSPVGAEGLGPFGSEFRPTDPSQLFVSNAHGGTNAGTVSPFGVARDGTLNSDRRLAVRRSADRPVLG